MQRLLALSTIVLSLIIAFVASASSARAGALEKRAQQLFAGMQQSRAVVASLLADDLRWRDMVGGATRTKDELLNGLSTEWALNLQRIVADVVERGDVVTLTVTQSSDLHRALGQPADVARVSLRFRGGKVVLGQIEPIGQPLTTSARFEAFRQWLQQRHSDEVSTLLPAGQMPGTGEMVKRVLVRATEWAGSTASN